MKKNKNVERIKEKGTKKKEKKGTKYVLVVSISEGVVFHSCVIKVIQGS
jgi:hypothetical protein